MKYIRVFFMCFGMFTAIPCPYRPWEEKSRNLMMVFFPIIGLIIGLLWYALYLITEKISLPMQLQAAALMIYPYLVTGFIHLDGFMDTSDAVLSRRPLEEKLRILKDPHTGAFAIISLAVLFIVCFAAMLAILEGINRDINRYENLMTVLILIPVISRVCSAFAVLNLKHLNHIQYSGEFRKKVSRVHTIVLILMGFLIFVAGYLADIYLNLSGNTFLPSYGHLVVLLTTIITYLISLFYAVRQLGGMSGDLSGYSLTMAEACAIVTIANILH